MLQANKETDPDFKCPFNPTVPGLRSVSPVAYFNQHLGIVHFKWTHDLEYIQNFFGFSEEDMLIIPQDPFKYLRETLKVPLLENLYPNRFYHPWDQFDHYSSLWMEKIDTAAHQYFGLLYNTMLYFYLQ